ncbi:hypothetical protein [Mycobacterium sp. SMC-4]|uniref:hypothetical protein n=1 Tax=Mycobacterium sp. SMC-4 TaxID=2857059 RepID=UPI003D08CDB3
MAGDEATEQALDALYSAPRDDFTAVRTRLAAEAKQRGDTAAAKRIAGSRKPTAAAWVVNVLALQTSARDRLADLGARLRDAHAAMDGTEIRSLTAEQRRLVDELAREGLRLAAVDAPTAALRDDVTATLQAAVADPEVTARLGRLAKAEQWSGFGEFGSATAVSSVKKDKPAPRAARQEPESPARRQQPESPARRQGPESPARRQKPPEDNRQRQRAHATLTAAQRAKAQADDALTELQADLATARLRHQDAERRLRDAQTALTAAQDAYDSGKQAVRDAAQAVRAADKEYRRAGG